MGEPAEALSVKSNGEIRGDPLVMLGSFICPTFSTVTTSKATGLEKTLLPNDCPVPLPFHCCCLYY